MEVRVPFQLHSICVAYPIVFLLESWRRGKLGTRSTSTQERRLEARLLARIPTSDRNGTEIARAVARVEARRLCHLAMMITDHLRGARAIFDASLCGSGDGELSAVLLSIEDHLGATIADELRAWRRAVSCACHHHHHWNKPNQ